MDTDNGYEKMINSSEEMDSLFVSYNISEKLKNAGFDYPCFAYYWDRDFSKNYINKERLHYTIQYKNHNDIPSRVSAPLYDQVRNWFRKKHNLYLEVNSFTEEHMDGNVKFVYEIRYKGEQYISESSNYEKFKNPTSSNDYNEAWNKVFDVALTEAIE